jgi:hypothetical protein
MPTQITNYGTMGILFNFAPNFGVQSGLTVAGGAAAGGQATGLLFNLAPNFGSQAGVALHW